MKEDKKPDAYSENARLLPHGSDLSAPAIKLDDIDSGNLDKTKKANNDRIIASEKDRKIFFDAVFGNSKPNKNLVEAAKRYQSKNT